MKCSQSSNKYILNNVVVQSISHLFAIIVILCNVVKISLTSSSKRETHIDKCINYVKRFVFLIPLH